MNKKRFSLASNLGAIAEEGLAKAQAESPRRTNSPVVKAVVAENAVRERMLQDYQGRYAGGQALPLQEIDPALIDPSPFIDRDPRSMVEGDTDFDALVESMRGAQRNVSPALVRPLPSGRFEVAYGHRRRAAAAVLGLNLSAFVAPLSDLEMLEALSLENTARKSPSPYELAMGLRRTLAYFASAEQERGVRSMASIIGISKSEFSRRETVASLDDRILAVFNDARRLTNVQWSQLTKAVKDAPEAVTARIEVASADRLLSDSERLAHLIGTPAGPKTLSIKRRRDGSFKVLVPPQPNLTEARLLEAIRTTLASLADESPGGGA